MDHPLISVIVPIYMIDRYLGICIESTINQTYKNLEIILVDDGSKDRCSDICDLYSRKDGRIKVIHKENGGLVSARKAGLKNATGEYVSCVDGDDWIEPSYIESLYNAAKDTSADIVCAGQTRDLFSQSAKLTNAVPAGIYEGDDLNRLKRNMISYGPFYRPGISTYLWNKLFRRGILSEPQLTVDDRISIGEDAAVSYPAMLRAKRIVVGENTGYHYRQREDSMLKQIADYTVDAEKIRYLFEYMMAWASYAPAEFDLVRQVTDYVLSIAIIRSGGRLPNDDYSTFDNKYYGRNVAVFSAGTFGQQLVNRFSETHHCNVVSWVDDDYWEYRRCCLDVDPVESLGSQDFDYVLIATVDSRVAEKVCDRLTGLGIDEEKILTVTVPDNKEALLRKFLEV